MLALLLAATAAAQGCSGEQRVTQACATTACEYVPECLPVDGEWAQWGEWGVCECGAQVASRLRSIAVDSSCGGIPVQGAQEESQPCDPDPEMCEVHVYKECGFSEWNPWSECTCGVLQVYRTRVLSRWSSDCGAPCDGELKETMPCDQMQFHECVEPRPCEYTAWQDWTPCTTSCGGGQQDAVRSIAHESFFMGAGCNDILHKTRECNTECCPDHAPADCAVGGWTEWGQCSKSCESGTRSRSREISQYPRNGGALCEREDLMQLEPCEEHPCIQVVAEDGVWGEWKDWTPCTNSCDGGYQTREREMEKYAKNGGEQPDGSFSEFRTCNEQGCDTNAVDCEFDSWSPWSSCSCACTGIRKSMRKISQHAAHGGKICKGGLSRVEACNLPDTPDGGGCPTLEGDADCKWADWTEWSKCSAECLGGVRTRRRVFPGEIEDGMLPSVDTGVCEGPIQEMEACNTGQCYLIGDAVDCEWNEWGGWGDCSASCDGGEQQRNRDIKTHARYGGKTCNAKNSVELQTCNSQVCHPLNFCAWSPWEAWGDCSMTCGGGQRERGRALEQMEDKPDDFLVDTVTLAELRNLKEQDEIRSFALFTVGASLLAVMAVWRSRSSVVAPVQFHRAPSTES